MKMVLCLLGLLSLCPLAWAKAGVDNSGGGMDMPMVTLGCQDTKIQFREFSVCENKLGAGGFVWVTSSGSQRQEYPTSLSYGNNGGRIIGFSDFYCTRNLIEINQSNWQLVSNCEGKQFTSQCVRAQ